MFRVGPKSGRHANGLDDSFFSGFAAAELKLDRAVDLRAVQRRPAAAAAAKT